MLAAVLFCALLVFILTSGAPVVDFDETNAEGYEFVFHDTNNLFLVLKDNSCYFFPSKDFANWIAFGSDQSKHNTESGAIWVIEHQQLIPRSIDEVRDIFRDRLADFRCQNKNIFVLDPYHILPTPVLSTAGNWWNSIFGK